MTEQFCPFCEDSTYHVIIQYEPEPNDAQIQSEDVPTDELQLVAGHLCCNCGDVIMAHVAEETRNVASRSADTNESDHAAEARRMAVRAIEDWNHLSDEEKYGTLHEIVNRLANAESNRSRQTGGDGDG